MEKQIIDSLKAPQTIIFFAGLVAFSVWLVPLIFRKVTTNTTFEKASWDISDFFVSICIFFTIIGIAQFFIDAETTKNKFVLIVLNAIFQLCTCCLLCLWLRKIKKSTWSSLGIAKISLKRALYSITAYIVFLPSFLVISVLSFIIITKLGYTPEKQEIVKFFTETHGTKLLISAGLAIIFIPIFEEFFFRAFLYSWLRSVVGVPTAIIISALCFSAVHGSLAGFIPIATLGALFALLYEKTQIIWIPILIHSLHNFFTILLVVQGIG
ncbi:lysostaphin resistance A-like protein [Candidatus Uabimicrobium sp. HlEnr_7]|uniref:CPBP family intramembrane glutamic endopeptidase n=1 Tax=Candidatus Uabimicrobium helgolandensis TaxID=3095367 RepID=UPI00355836D6